MLLHVMCDKVEKVDKLEYRSVIKFLVLEKIAPKEIHERLSKVYKESAPGYSSVKKWAARFKQGRLNVLDDRRSGRPTEVIVPESIQIVRKVLDEDPRLSISQISKKTGISKVSALTIVRKNLGMTKNKVSKKWIAKSGSRKKSA